MRPHSKTNRPTKIHKANTCSICSKKPDTNLPDEREQGKTEIDTQLDAELEPEEASISFDECCQNPDIVGIDKNLFSCTYCEAFHYVKQDTKVIMKNPCCNEPDIQDAIGINNVAYICANCGTNYPLPTKETDCYLDLLSQHEALREAYINLWVDVEDGTIRASFFGHRETFRKLT